jgi:succinate dehydrogenase / fumarate reductase cytochrome b subunit
MCPVENNKKRPVFLNLFRIRLPVTGVVSILHRLTGLFLVLALPVLLYLLQLSLESEAGYARARELLAQPPAQLALLALVWMLAQHFASGLRHLWMDVDIGLSRRAGRLTAWWVLAVSAVVTVWATAVSLL